MSRSLLLIAKFFVLCGLIGLPDCQSRADCAKDWDVGPLFAQYSLTLEPGERTEALGPLFYHQEKDSERTIAVPPLFSNASDPALEAKEFDFLYPLMTYDRYGPEYRWQLLQLLSVSGGQNQQTIPRTRFTLFPLYFQQRSPDQSQNYTALVPIYGHLKNRLLRDEIFFVMFPLYSQTRKRDVITDNYLYPLFHVRHGNGLSGWQFWPLVGQEHKDITTKTNGFGETETIGGHEKFFALWPIYNKENDGIGTDNPQQKVMLLPLINSLQSTNRDSTTVLWPLFTWTVDREKKYHEWDGPWPIVAVARGQGKTTTRFFPLFSQSSSTNLESDFYLWPVYKYNRIHSGPLDRDRTRILFFLYSQVNEKNLETGKARERIDFWPFFTHRRDFNGNSRLQLFAPIEPVLPNNKSVERNWSPLWSVWRAENNPKTGDASQSLLWNLYRRERTAGVKKCSLLFGLFQYESDAEASRLRVFFVPIGGKHKPPGAGTE